MKKKIILFFLILFTTICFSGCSKEDDTKTEVNTIEVNRTSTDISNLNDISNNTINNNIVSTNQANNKSNSSSSKVSNKSEELLAQFSTKIYSTDSARQNNLEITSKKLNGTVVKPNETFSFTKTIGPSTAAKGYEEADIYDSNGNKIKGYGGGNCQVSSTLYNAVQKVSSLEVVERHEHSNTVPYVKEGHDAAVAYGSVDFKFKNTRTYPIKIVASAKNGLAKVSFYGIKEETEYEVVIQSKTLSYIPYTVKYIEDSSLAKGKEVVSQSGYNGCKSEAYRVLKLNGKVVSKTLLSRDTYDPMQRIIRRGTNKTITKKNDTKKDESANKVKNTQSNVVDGEN